jgi:hypothetical protein
MKRTEELPAVIPPGAAARGQNDRTLDERPPMSISDPVLRAFLGRQAEEGRALVEASDILTLDCLSSGQHFVAHFTCKGLVKDPDGLVKEADSFHVGFFLGADYLRSANPYEVLTLLAPLNTFHPNVSFGAPFICPGHITPGMSLVDLLYQTYEILTYQKMTANNAFNQDACSWARANQARFPIDRRPLKRRALALEVERV